MSKRSIAPRGSGITALLVVIVVAVLVGAVIFALATDARLGYGERLRALEGRANLLVQQLRTEVSAPPPLRGEIDARATALTEAGVVRETNEERSSAGLPTLAVDAQLSAAAEIKLRDMFDRQYFDHVSPTGAGPAELAAQAGYAYVAIGENLALGNYEGDAALVAAWMASPGHRANILNGRFTEIGVAVGRGTFEGQQVWMAVQEFGKPLADCPPPSAALKTQIDAAQAELAARQATLDAQRAELEGYRGSRQEYNRKVAAYNAGVDAYNALLRQTRELVAAYNGQAEAFNACIAS